MYSFLSGAESGISPYIKHYEGLSYDREELHRKHLRARRATQPQEYTLQLDFTAFHRWLLLKSLLTNTQSDYSIPLFEQTLDSYFLTNNTCQPLIVHIVATDRSTFLPLHYKAVHHIWELFVFLCPSELSACIWNAMQQHLLKISWWSEKMVPQQLIFPTYIQEH